MEKASNTLAARAAAKISMRIAPTQDPQRAFELLRAHLEEHAPWGAQVSVELTLGHRLVRRVVSLAKSQNITSIADFVASRYGKSERVAALVSLIAVISDRTSRASRLGSSRARFVP